MGYRIFIRISCVMAHEMFDKTDIVYSDKIDAIKFVDEYNTSELTHVAYWEKE